MKNKPEMYFEKLNKRSDGSNIASTYQIKKHTKPIAMTAASTLYCKHWEAFQQGKNSNTDLMISRQQNTSLSNKT